MAGICCGEGVHRNLTFSFKYVYRDINLLQQNPIVMWGLKRSFAHLHYKESPLFRQ